METEKKRVACYARYSTNMQREESISAQVRAMKKFCADNDWKIVKIYVDQAYSATTDRRPEFQQMIDDSSKKMFEIVLVHKLDRFARSRHDSLIYKLKLHKNGVRLCSVLERLDNSPESILLEGMLESINEFYSANLARESLKGMKENAFQCLYNGGCPGLGYDVGEDGHFIINEHEAEAVRLIYDMYIRGYNYQEMADILNSENYRTKTGTPFKRGSFTEILRNERYTGVYIFNRSAPKGYDHKRNSHKNKPAEEIIRIEGGLPAIISKETFQTVRELMKNKGRHIRHSKEVYLLSKIIKCGCCGKPMYGNVRYRYSKPKFNVYVCISKKEDCDNIKEIDRDSLDEYAVELVLQKCFKDDLQLYDDFKAMDRSNPYFKTLLHEYVDEVTVYRDCVTFRIYVNGKIRTYKCKRISFKTPTQKTEKFLEN